MQAVFFLEILSAHNTLYSIPVKPCIKLAQESSQRQTERVTPYGYKRKTHLFAF